MSEANRIGFKELGGLPPMTFEAGLDSHPLQPLPLYYIDTPTGVRRGRQAVDGNGFNQRLDFWPWHRYICQMMLYRGSISSKHMESEKTPMSQNNRDLFQMDEEGINWVERPCPKCRTKKEPKYVCRNLQSIGFFEGWRCGNTSCKHMERV